MHAIDGNQSTSIPFKKGYLIFFFGMISVVLLLLALGIAYELFTGERYKYYLSIAFAVGIYGLISLLYRLFYCSVAIRLDISRIQLQFDFRKRSVPWKDIEKIDITKNTKVIGGEDYLNIMMKGGGKHKYYLIYADVASKDLALLIRKYSEIEVSFFQEIL